MSEKYIRELPSGTVIIVDPTETTKKVWDLFRQMKEHKRSMTIQNYVDDPATGRSYVTWNINKEIAEIELTIEEIRNGLGRTS